MSDVRGILLALTLLVLMAGATPALAADAATPAPPPAPAASDLAVFPDRTLPWTVLAGPDGALVGFDYRFDDGGRSFPQFARIEADGTARSADLPARAGARGELRIPAAVRPLTDGTLGAIVQEIRDMRVVHVVGVELLRIDPADGSVVSRVSLPPSAERSNAFALEADGTVWWARACRDRLYRRSPAGVTTTIRLPRNGCKGGLGSLDAEDGTALAVGADGAAWVVSFCGSRVVRYGADGRVRQWRTRGIPCFVAGISEDYIAAPTLTVDPRGGIAWFIDQTYFGSGSGTSTTGRGGRLLPDGRLLGSAPGGVPGFIGLDGSGWFGGTHVGPGGLRGKRPTLPRKDVENALPGRGGVFVVGATSTFVDQGKSSGYALTDAAVALLRDDGSRADWQLKELIGDEQADGPVGHAVVGGDGAFWFDVGFQLLRLTPSGLPAPRAPRAFVSGAPARDGRQLTLPVACDADLGRWCAGSVTLGADTGAGTGAGAGAGAAPARFLIPGQQAAGVRLRLSAAAARALRAGTALRTTATVAADGAAASERAVTLRPGRR